MVWGLGCLHFASIGYVAAAKKGGEPQRRGKTVHDRSRHGRRAGRQQQTFTFTGILWPAARHV